MQTPLFSHADSAASLPDVTYSAPMQSELGTPWSSGDRDTDFPQKRGRDLGQCHRPDFKNELCREKRVLGIPDSVCKGMVACMRGDLTERIARPVCESLNLPCPSYMSVLSHVHL